MERLDQRRSRPLTLVSAPTGYGKSVLISCWLAQCDIPSTWISLDENDHDLRVFAAYFVAAVEKLFPAACRNTHALLNAPNLPPISALANSLVNELDRNGILRCLCWKHGFTLSGKISPICRPASKGLIPLASGLKSGQFDRR